MRTIPVKELGVGVDRDKTYPNEEDVNVEAEDEWTTVITIATTHASSIWCVTAIGPGVELKVGATKLNP